MSKPADCPEQPSLPWDLVDEDFVPQDDDALAESLGILRDFDNTAAGKSKHVFFRTKSEVDLIDDGFRWKKYGQKNLKGTPYPRSYYRCPYVGCTVRKHVERDSLNPIFVLTTYNGVHNHGTATPGEKAISHGTTKPRSIHDSSIESDNCHATNLDCESDSNLMIRQLKIGSSQSDYTREMDGVVTSRTKNKSNVFDDGYRWRKYGQKVVIGSAFPRAYYRCTHPGCPARKTLQRDLDDPEFLITEVQNAHSHAAVAPTKGKSNSLDTARRSRFSPVSEYHASRLINLDPISKSSAAGTRRKGNVCSMYTSDPLRFGSDKGRLIKTASPDDAGLGLSANNGYSSFSNPSFVSGYGNNNETLPMLRSKTGFYYSGTASIIDFGVETSFTEKALPPPATYSLISGSEESYAINLDLGAGLSSSAENTCYGKQDAEKVGGRTLALAESNRLQFQSSIYMEEVYLSRSASPYLCAHNLISIFLPRCEVEHLWNGGEQETRKIPS